MLKIFKWVEEETLKVFPAVIYFGIAFNLIYYTIGLSLGPNDIRHMTYFTVNLSALITGKVLIISNSLPFFNAFPKKPLIYNIVWKFFIYNAVIFLLRMLEMFLHPYFHHGFNWAIKAVHADLVSESFWSSEMWVALVFLVFVVFVEIAQALGKEKVLKMLFGIDTR